MTSQRAVSFGALLMIAVTARPCAAQKTWTGGGATNNWSTASNWSPSGAPVSSINNAFVFGASSQTAPSNNIAASFDLNSITINAGAPAYSINGSSLDFRTNGSSVLPKVINNSSNVLTFAASAILTHTTTFGGSGITALSSSAGAVLSGAGGLTKTGAGTLYLLPETNTFSGALTIEAGTVYVGRLEDSGVASSIGAGSSIVLGGATTAGTLHSTDFDLGHTNRNFTLNAGGGVISFGGGTLPRLSIFTGVVSGLGGLTVTGVTPGKSLYLRNANTYEGPTVVTGGQHLLLQNAAALGQSSDVTLTQSSLGIEGFTISGKTLTMNPSGTSASGLLGSSPIYSVWDGGITVNGDASHLHLLSGRLTVNGVISGSGGMRTLGPITLSNANTFTGGMTMQSSGLTLTNDLALQNSTLTLEVNGVNLSTTTAPPPQPPREVLEI